MFRLMMIVVALWIAACEFTVAYIAYDTWQMDKQFFDENYLNENDSQEDEPNEVEV